MAKFQAPKTMTVLPEGERVPINCCVCGEVGPHKWLDHEYSGVVCRDCMLDTVLGEVGLLSIPGLCRPTPVLIASRL